MKNIFIALIVIFFVTLLILALGFFVLTSFIQPACTMVGCIEGLTIYTDEKLSDDISIVAEGTVLIDLCKFNETERKIGLNNLYLFSNNEQKPFLIIEYPEMIPQKDLEKFIALEKYKVSDIEVWQIFTQPNCVGQKQLLYEIKNDDIEFRESQPNGPGCGTCESGFIDLSS